MTNPNGDPREDPQPGDDRWTWERPADGKPVFGEKPGDLESPPPVEPSQFADPQPADPWSAPPPPSDPPQPSPPQAGAPQNPPQWTPPEAPAQWQPLVGPAVPPDQHPPIEQGWQQPPPEWGAQQHHPQGAPQSPPQGGWQGQPQGGWQGPEQQGGGTYGQLAGWPAPPAQQEWWQQPASPPLSAGLIASVWVLAVGAFFLELCPLVSPFAAIVAGVLAMSGASKDPSPAATALKGPVMALSGILLVAGIAKALVVLIFSFS